MPTPLALFLALLLAYLLGSIPLALWITMWRRGVDIRRLGDRNPGAANAYREIDPASGIGVGVGDAGKGIVALLVSLGLGVVQPWLYLSGAAAVAGHNWPLFASFKGGRGAATTIGVLFFLLPKEMALLSGVALLPLLITRSTTVACAIIFAPLPLVAWLWGAPLPAVLYSIGLPGMAGVRHYMTTRHLSSPAFPGASGGP